MIVNQNPNKKANVVMQMIGSIWQNMADGNRQYYQDKADTDRLRYLEEMRAYYDEVESLGQIKGTVKNKGCYKVQMTDEDHFV